MYEKANTTSVTKLLLGGTVTVDDMERWENNGDVVHVDKRIIEEIKFIKIEKF